MSGTSVQGECHAPALLSFLLTQCALEDTLLSCSNQAKVLTEALLRLTSQVPFSRHMPRRVSLRNTGTEQSRNGG